MPKTTPKQRHSANAARKIIEASKYAQQFKKDPEAAIADVLTDVLHLATLDRDTRQTPEELVDSAFNHARAEAGPEGMAVEGPKEGKLFTVTGVVVTGILQSLRGVANINGMTSVDEEVGFEPQFTGDTDVDWDSQKDLVTANGQVICIDDNGREWERAELLWVSDEVPARFSKVDPVQLENFLTHHPDILKLLQGSLTIARSKETPTLEQIMLVLTSPRTTKAFRKFRLMLNRAIWSEQYRLNQL